MFIENWRPSCSRFVYIFDKSRRRQFLRWVLASFLPKSQLGAPRTRNLINARWMADFRWLSRTQCCHENQPLFNPIFTRIIGIILQKGNLLQAGSSKDLSSNTYSSGIYAHNRGNNTIWAFWIDKYTLWITKRIANVTTIHEWWLALAFATLDDILIASMSTDENVINFMQLNEFSMIVNSEKCAHGASQMECLG